MQQRNGTLWKPRRGSMKTAGCRKWIAVARKSRYCRKRSHAGSQSRHPRLNRPTKIENFASCPRALQPCKRLGITVEELAALLGVSPQSIYNWQTGKSVPRRAQLEKLASIRGMGKREAEALLASN
ncbi:MAG: helix-turn-helix transcriptional regulator [Dokdonella sp.]|nr:helix-turn-helix transcriptional regulator [Dokdonella sp.]